MGKSSKGRNENNRQEAVNYNVVTEQPRSSKSEAIDPLMLHESEKGSIFAYITSIGKLYRDF